MWLDHRRPSANGFTLVELPLDRLGAVSKCKRSAFTLVELLVVIAIIGILVALLLPAVQAARESARRTQCQNNLHNLGIGAQNYNDTHKSYPTGFSNPRKANGAEEYTSGMQMTASNARFFANWAIEILPYVEEQPLYDSFVLYDEGPTVGTALNDFPNRAGRGTVLSYMLCPSDNGRSSFCSMSGGNWARGNYGYNMGLGFFWAHRVPTDEQYPWKRQCGRGVGGVNRGATVAQIEDGTTKTILFGELRVGLSERDRRGTWAMPMVGSNLLAEQASNFGGPPNDCFLGNDDITDRALIEADVGVERLELECMTMGWDNSVSITLRSRHPGGVHVAMCDASVRFVSDNVHFIRLPAGYEDRGGTGRCWPQEGFAVWQRLNSSNDGYVIDGSEY